jgi:hypothetical protein
MIGYILQQPWASFTGQVALSYQAVFDDMNHYGDVGTRRPTAWH